MQLSTETVLPGLLEVVAASVVGAELQLIFGAGGGRVERLMRIVIMHMILVEVVPRQSKVYNAQDDRWGARHVEWLHRLKQ